MSFIFFLPFLCVALSHLVTASPTQELLAPVLTSDKLKWEDCGHSTDAIQIESLSVSPDPPQPGQNLTMSAIGIVQSIIEEGAYADASVTIGYIKLPPKRFDLCEEARQANATIQCPVEKGKYTVEQTVTLPKDIPSALIKVYLRAYTSDEEDMACVNLEVDFRKKALPSS